MYVEPALNDASQYKISLRSIGPEDDTTQISKVGHLDVFSHPHVPITSEVSSFCLSYFVIFCEFIGWVSFLCSYVL